MEYSSISDGYMPGCQRFFYIVYRFRWDLKIGGVVFCVFGYSHLEVVGRYNIESLVGCCEGGYIVY